MLKVTAGLVSCTLALCLPQSVFADPKPAPPPQRVLITYQVLEVPGNTGIPDSTSSTASEFYKNALQNIKKSEATEISVQTPDDSPGAARYDRILTFSVQEHGKPQQVSLVLPTSLEATPHINLDGTITVQLKTEVTRAAPAAPDAVPLTNRELWHSQQTFKNGETRNFGSIFEFTSMSLPIGIKSIPPPQNDEFVQFVTVTVLPAGKAAQP